MEARRRESHLLGIVATFLVLAWLEIINGYNAENGTHICSSSLHFTQAEYFTTVLTIFPPGSTIFQVSAYVSTICGNTSFTSNSGIGFSLEDNSLFHIDNKTATIRIISTLTNVSKTQYHLLLNAQFRNSNISLVTNSTLLITIKESQPSSVLADYEFNIHEFGFLQSAATSNSASFGIFVNAPPGTLGKVSAKLGSLQASQTFVTATEHAIHVSAVLVEKDIWYSQPEVTIIIQVKDESFNVVTLSETNDVIIRITPSEELALVKPGIIEATCSPSSTTGLCTQTISLPPEYFKSNPSTITSYNCTVSYRIIHSNMSMKHLDHLQIHPYRKPNLFREDVYAIIPANEVYRDNVIPIKVLSKSSYALATFSVVLVTGLGLDIANFTIDDSSWLYVDVKHDKQKYAVSGIRSDPEQVHEGAVEEEKLLTFYVRVSTSAKEGSLLTIKLQINYISGINNYPILINDQWFPAAGAIVSGKSSERKSVGYLKVGSDVVRGLLPYAESGEIVNTAVLDGKKISIPLVLLSVRSSGIISTLQGGVSCSIVSQNVLQVTENCSEAYVDGTEIRGLSEAVILVRYQELSANISIRVWYPSLPLQLVLHNSELGAVKDVKKITNVFNCEQKYQQTKIEVYASISHDGLKSYNIFVTHLIKFNLRVLNDSIALVSDNADVIGLNPGSTTISAYSPISNQTLGTVKVTVNNSKVVDVLVLDMIVATDLRMDLFTVKPYKKLSTQTASVTVLRNISMDLTNSYVFVYAIFSDGIKQLISQKDGLNMSTDNEDVIKVINNSLLVAVGSGRTAIKAEWRSLSDANCSNVVDIIAYGYQEIVVNLTEPEEVSISGVLPQITYPNDNVQHLGIPTWSPIVVKLRFLDGLMVDVTRDTRTIFDLSSSDQIFNVTRDHDNNPIITGGNNKKGRKALIVRFKQFKISQSVEINVVGYVSLTLQVKPYPPYDGSKRKYVGNLYAVSGTTYHQRAIVCLSMLLTDANKIDITHNPETVFTSCSPQLTMGNGGRNYISIIPNAVEEPKATIAGKYKELSETKMYIKITNEVVVIKDLYHFHTTSRSSTLSGLIDTVVDTVSLSFMFNDSTIIEDYYKYGFYPGLITLSSSEPSVVTVNTDTAEITLRNNHHKVIQLQAKYGENSSTLDLTANLEPDVGDVDLGDTLGVPLKPQEVGANFNISVRFNAGYHDNITMVFINLVFTENIIVLTSFTNQNFSQYTVSTKVDSPGNLKLKLTSCQTLRGVVHFADLTFKANKKGTTKLLGTVDTVIVRKRNIIAGNIVQEVIDKTTISRRRRSVTCPDTEPMRGSVCSGDSCSCTHGKVLGDLNGDCVVDTKDSEFLLSYFTTNFDNLIDNSIDSNNSFMDVDKNGFVNPSDSYYLHKVFLGLLYFVEGISVVPVQDMNSNCQLQFMAKLSSIDKRSVSSEQTRVYFDITYFSNQPGTIGNSDGVIRSVGIYGNTLIGENKGNGTFQYSTSTEFIASDVSLTVILLTTDDSNKSSSIRNEEITGFPNPPYVFSFSEDRSLIIGEGNVYVLRSTYGLNPYIMFNNSAGSFLCENIYTPVFAENAYYATLSENEPIGTTFGPVFASDNDTGNRSVIVYSITHGNIDGIFTINSTSGVISTIELLNRERTPQYNLTVTASDNAPPGRKKNAHVSMLVTLLDVNDDVPRIRSVYPSKFLAVPENAEVGSKVSLFLANDDDLGDNGTCFFEIAAAHNFLDVSTYNSSKVNECNGELFVNSSLDGFAETTLKSLIIVKDKGLPPLWINFTMTVKITFADDVMVVFDELEYNSSIKENSPIGTHVISLSAYVPGLQRAKLVYSLENVDNFTVDPINGNITSITELDREVKNVFEFLAVVHYGNIKSSTLVKINITDENDNFPNLIPIPPIRVPCSVVVSSSIYQVNATDLDAGQNADLRYFMNGTELFHIDQYKGDIIVKNNLCDFNTTLLNLTVSVRDQGEVQRSDMQDISVFIYQYPKLGKRYNFSIPENAAVSYRIISLLPENLNFSLFPVNYTYSLNQEGNHFSINYKGDVTLSTHLDYELQQFHIINVSATDVIFPELSVNVTLSITVVDINDMTPVIQHIRPLYIIESIPTGTLVTTITASDADAGDNARLNYTIGQGNDEGIFSLDVPSGVLRTAVTIDYESTSSFNLTINVTDNGQPPRSTSDIITIYVMDVNDNYPIFKNQSYEINIDENIMIGNMVTIVSATDHDSIAHGGIVYTFLNGNVDRTFRINSSSGEITLDKSLDYESTQSYIILVEARDFYPANYSQGYDVIGWEDSLLNTQLRAFVNVTIHINDVNDNAPLFKNGSYHVTISENLHNGTKVLQIEATDADSFHNGKFIFSLYPSGGCGVFAFNSQTGEMRLKTDIWEYNYMNYNLTVTATDFGSPSLNNSVDISIIVNFYVKFDTSKAFRSVALEFYGGLASDGLTSYNDSNFDIQFWPYFPSGSLNSSISKYSAHKSFECESDNALLSTIVLNNPKEIWPDDNKVNVAVQVRDKTGNLFSHSIIVETKVEFPNSTDHVNSSCSTSIASGTCSVEITMPPSFFDRINYNIQRFAKIYSRTYDNAFNLVDKVEIKKEPAVQVSDRIVLNLPSYYILAGQNFVIPLYSYFTETVSTLALAVSIDKDLEIIAIHESALWTVSKVDIESNTFGLMAFRDSSISKRGSVSELIVTLEMKLKDNPKPNPLITCEIKDASYITRRSINLDEIRLSDVLFTTRDGLSPIGQIYAQNDTIEDIFVFTETTNFLNLAVITGQRMEQQLSIVGYTVSGKSYAINDAFCRSFKSDILKVDSRCSIYVDGTEAEKPDQVNIEVTYQTMSKNITITVWMIESPLTISIDDRELHAIRDWKLKQKGICTTKYQKSQIKILVNLTSARNRMQNLDMTEELIHHIKSSKTNVAVITSGAVAGLQEGETEVFLETSSGMKMGNTTVTVTTREVRVYALKSIIVNAIDIHLVHCKENGSAYGQVKITFHPWFEYMGQMGTVITWAQFSDGHVQLVTSSEGKVVTSSNEVITVNGNEVKSLSYGKEETTSRLYSKECENKELMKTLVGVTVKENAAQLLIDISGNKMAPNGTTADIIRISDKIKLTIQLIFVTHNGKSYKKDIDRQHNLELHTSSENGAIINHVITGNNITLSAGNQIAGKATVTISIKSLQLNKSIEIEIVSVLKTQLVVYPYPSFEGSEKYPLHELKMVQDNGIYQQAVLKFLATLSDQRLIDVTKLDEKSVHIKKSNPPALIEDVSIQYEENKIDPVLVLKVKESGRNGDITLQGLFKEIRSPSILLKIMPDPLSIYDLIIQNPGTVEGIKDSELDALSVTVVFTDGSRISSRSLSNVLKFYSEQPGILQIDKSTGVMMVKGNSITAVKLLVSTNDQKQSHSINVNTNLKPQLGDIDFGQQNGLPLTTQQVDKTFQLPVYLNTGKKSLGSFQIRLNFNKNIISVKNIVPGNDVNLVFVHNVHDLSTDLIGISLTNGSFGERLHILTMELSANSLGVVELSGEIKMIVDTDLVQIGSTFPRAIIAGNIEIKIGSSSASHNAAPQRRKRRKRAIAVDQCTTNVEGDIDGNCVFDVRDIQIAFMHLSNQQFNKTSNLTVKMSSPNKNQYGRITLDDVTYLLNSLAGLVPTKPILHVTPVENRNSKCLLSVDVTANQLGLSSIDVNSARIFFLLVHNSKEFKSQFSKAEIIMGKIASELTSGFIIESELLKSEMKFKMQANTTAVFNDIGIMVCQVFFESGVIRYDRTAAVFGLSSDYPAYAEPLNATIDLGGGLKYRFYQPNAYNPLIKFNNALSSDNCSDSPLLGVHKVQVTNATTVSVSWSVNNVRKNLNFSFVLNYKQCYSLSINQTCHMWNMTVYGYQYKITGLKPFTRYDVQVTSGEHPAIVKTNWTAVTTHEAVPTGVNAPTIARLTSSSLNISWSPPTQPNGIIISFILYMKTVRNNEVVYQGNHSSFIMQDLKMGLVYNFYVKASTSAGGTMGPEASFYLSDDEEGPDAGAREKETFGTPEIIGISVGGFLFFCLLLIGIITYVKLRNLRSSQLIDKREVNHNNPAVNGSSEKFFSQSSEMKKLRAKGHLHLRKQSLQNNEMYINENFTLQGLDGPWETQRRQASKDNETFPDQQETMMY